MSARHESATMQDHTVLNAARVKPYRQTELVQIYKTHSLEYRVRFPIRLHLEWKDI